MLGVALRFGYDGQTFPAYARAPSAPGSVEEHLIVALAEEGLVEGSFRTGSRTDAGVSAVGNVCRVVLDRPHTHGLLPALRAHLHSGIWPTGHAHVPLDWNPRHADHRHYVHWSQAGGDLEAAQAAAGRFLGRHDMRAFARVEEGRAPVRTVTRCTVREEDGLWRVDVAGPSFLWNQVRRMVGALQAVGTGRATADDVTSSLASGRPHPSFTPGQPEGLVLWDVVYPDLAWETPGSWRGLQRVHVAAHARAAVASEALRRLNGSA